MKEINHELLAEAVHRIVQAVHPEQILLFGSQVWGHPTDESDIDLMIIVSTSNQPEYRRAREIYRSLRGIQLPIDVLVRTRDEIERAAQVPISLERQVLEQGRELHG
ncbi:MAG: nucleotidyltransferase domain-containing protein [Thiohalocapsa sp.]